MDQAAGEDITRLAEEVGDTLRKVLAESPQVSQCLARIRAEGYDVSVVLDATIGLSRAEAPAASVAVDVRLEKTDTPPLRMTPLDKKFLRSLKITVDEDE